MNKNDRKVLALTLAIVLLLSMSISVSAANTTVSGVGEFTYDEVSLDGIDVEVKIGITGGEIIYNLDVSWDDLIFTYDFGTWDPETHQYTAGWDKTSASISVTNHSNAEVTVDATYDNYDTVAGVTVEMSGDGYWSYNYWNWGYHLGRQLESGVGKSYYAADFAQFDVHVFGEPTWQESSAIRSVGTVRLSFYAGGYYY